MLRPQTLLRRAVRVTGFAALTSGLLPLYMLEDRLSEPAARSAVRDRWLRRWSRHLLGLFGVHVELIGAVRPPAHGRLVVANHRSTIDVGILLGLFGGHMVSRADLADWPVVGPAARRVGTVFVERGDARSGARTMRAIRDLVKRGQTVCVFPEGTTFADDTVRPFHPGAFVAGIGTSSEIVPVGIAYPRDSGAAFVGESFLSHLSRMSGAPPTTVVVALGEPMTIDRKSRAVELRDHAQVAVQRLVERARAHSDELERAR